MAPQKPKLPLESLHIGLERPALMNYRDAYIGDVVRYTLVPPENMSISNPAVGTGIYIDARGGLVEKYFEAAPVEPETPPAPAPIDPYRTEGRVYSHQYASSASNSPLVARPMVSARSAIRGAQPGQAPRGPRAGSYTTDDSYFVPKRMLDSYERTPRLFIGRWHTFPAPTGRPVAYAYGARVALFPQGSFEPVSVLEGGRVKVVVYVLMIDTAGVADSYVFGNLSWEDFARVDSTSECTEEDAKRSYEEKMKMLYPDYDASEADESMLCYGIPPNSIITVLVKAGICSIMFDHWTPPLRIKNFPIGIVYGASDGELTNPFDGLLGLGRGTKCDSNARRGSRFGPPITLPEAAWRQGLVRSRDFWVHITHPTWDNTPERDFMCLGAYKDPLSNKVPNWFDLDCDVNSGSWKVTLCRIVVYDSRERRKTMLNHNFENLLVKVDTASTQTYLPTNFVDAVEQMFETKYNVPRGSASYALSKSIVVRFYFISDGKEKYIEAQAVRFFTSPLYVDADHPAMDLKPANRNLLGLNFFRTFIVGFRDHETKPRLSIAAHPNVHPKAVPLSACRGPSQAGVAPQAPAHLSGDAAARQPSQSEQFAFPQFGAPLPGEDAGQGSSRHPLGFQEQSAYPVAGEASTYGRRTGHRPSQSYMQSVLPQQASQQPAGVYQGAYGTSAPPQQRLRRSSLPSGALLAGSVAAPVPGAAPLWPGAAQQWQAAALGVAQAGAPPQPNMFQTFAAPIPGMNFAPPAVQAPAPPPVLLPGNNPAPASSSHQRRRSTSFATGIKSFFGFGGGKDKKPGRR